MIDVKKYNDDIISIHIYEPRSSRDEEVFLKTLSELEVNIKNNISFALLLEVKGPAKFSLEARKAMHIWFKTFKNDLAINCYGFARVNSEANKLARFRSKAISITMPCAYRVLSTHQEGLDWLVKKNKKSFFTKEKILN